MDDSLVPALLGGRWRSKRFCRCSAYWCVCTTPLFPGNSLGMTECVCLSELISQALFWKDNCFSTQVTLETGCGGRSEALPRASPVSQYPFLAFNVVY